MSKENKYPCPACGFLFFDYQPKDDQVCPLCEINDIHALNKVIDKPVNSP